MSPVLTHDLTLPGLDVESSLYPLEETSTTRTQYRQFEVMFRLRNVTNDPMEDIVVRNYLPVDDDMQSVDWVVFGDLDWRLSEQSISVAPPSSQPDYEVLEFESTGFTNRYVEWRIPELPPGLTVQLGFVAGLRIRRKRLFRCDSSTGWEKANCRDHDPVPRSTQPMKNDMAEAVLSLQALSPTLLDGPLDISSDGGPHLPAEGLPFSSPSSSDQRWSNARFVTAGIDWDHVDALLLDHIEPGVQGSDPFTNWYLGTRARRIATFVNAVVAGGEYPGGAEPEGDPDIATAEGTARPGTRAWPQMVFDRAAVAQATLSAGLVSTMFGSFTVDALRLGARDLYPWVLGDGYRRCACSENTYLSLWFLRCAGIACRELAGWGRHAIEGMDESGSGDAIGHRTVEAFDPETDAWFPIDSTRWRLGPSFEDVEGRAPSLAVTTFRGMTGMGAPSGFDYDAWVVSYRRPESAERQDWALPGLIGSDPTAPEPIQLWEDIEAGEDEWATYDVAARTALRLHYVATGTWAGRMAEQAVLRMKSRLRLWVLQLGVAPLSLLVPDLGPNIEPARTPGPAEPWSPPACGSECGASPSRGENEVGDLAVPLQTSGLPIRSVQAFEWALGAISVLAAPSTVVDIDSVLLRNYLTVPARRSFSFGPVDRRSTASKWGWQFLLGQLHYRQLRWPATAPPSWIEPVDLLIEFVEPDIFTLFIALGAASEVLEGSWPLPRLIAGGGDGATYRLRNDWVSGRLTALRTP